MLCKCNAYFVCLQLVSDEVYANECSHESLRAAAVCVMHVSFSKAAAGATMSEIGGDFEIETLKKKAAISKEKLDWLIRRYSRAASATR